jgi:glycosyltransferase involved in cell wall biosynthesis
MRAGAYNLGFLALGSLSASDAFIKWWERKLEHGAASDTERGLFTDQKWVDLAPGMFGGFAILRDPGYNVAYWNFAQRPVRRKDNVWFAGPQPLRFFHFSGFDPLNPEPFSKHQNRLTLSTIGEARELALEYAERVLRHGFAEFRKRPYAFGSFADGTPIPSAIRALYREDADVRFQAGKDPFECAGYFVRGETGGLPIILRALWLKHRHLQRVFPDPLGANRLPFYNWFAEGGGAEVGIPEAFILPIRRALSLVRVAEDIGFDPRAKPSVWARGLMIMHKQVTGSKPSIAWLKQYYEVTGPIAFLWLGLKQFRRSRWAKKVGVGRSTVAQLDPLAPTGPPLGAATTARLNHKRFSGLYAEPGKHAWWIGRQARFVVDRAASTHVRLRGIHHGELHQSAHGKQELNIYVGFNEEPRRPITVQTGHFDVTVVVEKLPDAWPATLYVLPEATFVPRELGLSDDSRHLSVQIIDISIGTSSVFNAARRTFLKAPSVLAVPAVNVIGYARSEHGVGQSLRQFAAALDAASIPNVVIDFNINNSSRVEDLSLKTRIVDEPVHGINVFHINADQMPEAEMHLPVHFFSRYNIGFWHWELPEMSDEHLAGFDTLSEVWVPSGFVQDAVAKRSPVPVVRMPHAINFSVTQGASRARFGLPEDRFLFLMMYDFSSYQERKNPQGALAAFCQAFAKQNSRVTLVVKTQNGHFHDTDAALLGDRLRERKDVIWINETLSRQEAYDLEFVCDALVSLHRSEGFGLVPAEAMFLGKPVIATNWSGNTEFMKPQNSLPVNYALIKLERDIGVYKAGQTWADPDVEHAAWLMRQIVDDEGLRRRISAEAQRTMREEYNPRSIGQRIHARLEYVQSELLSN